MACVVVIHNCDMPKDANGIHRPPKIIIKLVMKPSIELEI